MLLKEEDMTRKAFQGDTSVVVLIVLCLGDFVLFAPYVCYHIFS